MEPNELTQKQSVTQQLKYPLDYVSQSIMEDHFKVLLAKVLYPIGCLFETTLTDDPFKLLGFGTWSLYGAGKVRVCIDTGDADFNVVGETGGIKSVSLSVAELPAHHHGGGAQFTGGGASSGGAGGYTLDTDTDDTGSGSAHTNLQPYIVTYLYTRTA